MVISKKYAWVFGVLALLGQRVSGQGMLPAPNAAGNGYFLQMADPASTPNLSGAVQPAVATSQNMATSWVQPASCGGSTSGCNSCGDLWAGACDPDVPCDISGACNTGCDTNGGLWNHYTTATASLLYLRPRNADVAYGVPIDGPIVAAPANNPIQVGRVGVVDPGYDVGFDVGLSVACNALTSVYGNLTMLDTSSSDSIATAAPDVIRSIVSHPSSTSAATDFLSGRATLDMELDLIDVGIRHLFVGGRLFAVNYLVGARYGRLNQDFAAQFVDNGTEDVRTDIDFDGVGFRLGLEAERQSCRSQFRIYSRAFTSFLAGKFSGVYHQGQSFDPVVVNTQWEAGRIVPVLDMEVGGGWMSHNGRVRLGAGYLVSAWFNTVKTEEFIQSVQQNNFTGLSDTLTFDGLRATAEVRF